MSYIYEALKKAEDEHKRGAVAVRATGRRTLFSGKPPWWLWALIGVLGANVLVLGTLAFTVGSRWSGLRGAGERAPLTEDAASSSRTQSTVAKRAPSAEADRPADGAARAASVAPPAVTTPAPPVAAAPPAPAAPSAPSMPPPTTSPPPTAAPRVSATPSIPPAPPAEAPSARTSRMTAAVPSAPARAGAPPAPPAISPGPAASTAPAAPSETSRPAVVPAPAAPTPRGDAAASRGTRAEARATPPRVDRQPAQSSAGAQEPAPARPAARDVTAPQDARPNVADARPKESGPPVEAPKATLQVIVYSDVPSQRMVFIDGQRYGEGDALDPETVIERINSDGVVVKRRGVRFVIAGRRD